MIVYARNIVNLYREVTWNRLTLVMSEQSVTIWSFVIFWRWTNLRGTQITEIIKDSHAYIIQQTSKFHLMCVQACFAPAASDCTYRYMYIVAQFLCPFLGVIEVEPCNHMYSVILKYFLNTSTSFNAVCVFFVCTWVGKNHRMNWSHPALQCTSGTIY